MRQESCDREYHLETRDVDMAENAVVVVVALGLCKERKCPNIRDFYGSGWLGPGLTRIFVWKYRPKIALNQY